MSVANFFDIFLHKTVAIQQLVGSPPETLNTLQQLASSITNDKNILLHHHWNVEQKRKSSDAYTKSQIQHVLMNLIDNAPAPLDMLNKLATALAEVATFAS